MNGWMMVVWGCMLWELEELGVCLLVWCGGKNECCGMMYCEE